MSHGRDSRDASTLATTMVIGSSVARAFSLVGALSLVRFRTVVDDTRDTAFVIFALIVGMAAGTSIFSPHFWAFLLCGNRDCVRAPSRGESDMRDTHRLSVKAALAGVTGLLRVISPHTRRS
ncbi:MAG: hypothetical protein SGJ09_09330 [Phycisphaerae bacterium]|nr:hypothetical protein [Phycisphaerae bacterium]